MIKSNKDTEYHDRLEQEVTRLKRDIILLESKNTELDFALKRSHAEIAGLRLDNEQLRQSIAVLNDEPTNSL
jgi:predicted  nucleic acid-binding Zn-ribbon protein